MIQFHLPWRNLQELMDVQDFKHFIKLFYLYQLLLWLLQHYLVFMASWSEYVILYQLFLQDPKLYTLPLGLKSFQASLSTEWGLYLCWSCSCEYTCNNIIYFLIKYLVSGLTMGSVKG